MKGFSRRAGLFAGGCMLLGIMALTAVETPGAEATRMRNPEAVFAAAYSMLGDRSVKNISVVPAMLEGCVEEGYVPAAALLLDVYEGRYVGLSEQPAKAAKLAYRLAGARPPKDEKAAAKKLRLEAMFRCAMYKERGYGCRRNAEDAYRWMYFAAAENLPKARVELARYCMGGTGCRRNPKLALALLHEQERKAPDTPNLYFYLGYMYYYGIGLRHRNFEQAAYYYEKGAARGDARATNNLAALYERGLGVSKSTEKALRYYRMAALAGNKDASANMQRLGYMAGEEATTVRQRVNNASLRVVRYLPLPHHIKDLLTDYFSSGSSAPRS